MISCEEFKIFLKRHEYLNPVIKDDELMIKSYVMIDRLADFIKILEMLILLATRFWKLEF